MLRVGRCLMRRCCRHSRPLRSPPPSLPPSLRVQLLTSAPALPLTAPRLGAQQRRAGGTDAPANSFHFNLWSVAVRHAMSKWRTERSGHEEMPGSANLTAFDELRCWSYTEASQSQSRAVQRSRKAGRYSAVATLRILRLRISCSHSACHVIQNGSDSTALSLLRGQPHHNMT